MSLVEVTTSELVDIAPVGVRVLGVAATKMDIGMTLYTEGAPMVHQDLSGRSADQS